jgi:hypothetical protein
MVPMVSVVARVLPPHQMSRSIAPRAAPRSALRFAMPWRCLAMSLAMLSATLSAHVQSAANDCDGLDFDVAKPVVVAKVISVAPQVHYVKGPTENPSCPADIAACRSDAYLSPGDLVLANNLRAPYTCVTHQSLQATQQIWSNGWFPSASLASVAPLRTPRPADWIGTWSHPGGEIRIEPADKGKLAILGFQAYPGTQNEHTGAMQAQAAPSGATLGFADDGSKPFGKDENDCQVRMQRVDTLLIVEDNGLCGGVAVTFTGFYRRKP